VDSEIIRLPLIDDNPLGARVIQAYLGKAQPVCVEVDPSDRDLVRQYINISQVHSGVPVPPFEHRIVRKDGSTRWNRETIVHRFDEARRRGGYDDLIEDVSERTHAEESLRQQEIDLAAAQCIRSRLWPRQIPVVSRHGHGHGVDLCALVIKVN
jgi:hypothetical protein